MSYHEDDDYLTAGLLPKEALKSDFAGEFPSIWKVEGQELLRDEDPFAELNRQVQDHMAEKQDIQQELLSNARSVAEKQDILDTTIAGKLAIADRLSAVQATQLAQQRFGQNVQARTNKGTKYLLAWDDKGGLSFRRLGEGKTWDEAFAMTEQMLQKGAALGPRTYVPENWDPLAEKTAAQRADGGPAQHCNSCGSEWKRDSAINRCPNCGSKNIQGMKLAQPGAPAPAGAAPSILEDWFQTNPGKNSVLIYSDKGFFDINRPNAQGMAFVTPIKYVQKAGQPSTQPLNQFLQSIGNYNITKQSKKAILVFLQKQAEAEEDKDISLDDTDDADVPAETPLSVDEKLDVIMDELGDVANAVGAEPDDVGDGDFDDNDGLDDEMGELGINDVAVSADSRTAGFRQFMVGSTNPLNVVDDTALGMLSKESSGAIKQGVKRCKHCHKHIHSGQRFWFVPTVSHVHFCDTCHADTGQGTTASIEGGPDRGAGSFQEGLGGGSVGTAKVAVTYYCPNCGSDMRPDTQGGMDCTRFGCRAHYDRDDLQELTADPPGMSDLVDLESLIRRNRSRKGYMDALRAVINAKKALAAGDHPAAKMLIDGLQTLLSKDPTINVILDTLKSKLAYVKISAFRGQDGQDHNSGEYLKITQGPAAGLEGVVTIITRTYIVVETADGDEVTVNGVQGPGGAVIFPVTAEEAATNQQFQRSVAGTKQSETDVHVTHPIAAEGLVDQTEELLTKYEGSELFGDAFNHFVQRADDREADESDPSAQYFSEVFQLLGDAAHTMTLKQVLQALEEIPAINKNMVDPEGSQEPDENGALEGDEGYIPPKRGAVGVDLLNGQYDETWTIPAIRQALKGMFGDFPYPMETGPQIGDILEAAGVPGEVNEQVVLGPHPGLQEQA